MAFSAFSMAAAPDSVINGDAKSQGDAIMKSLIRISAPEVKGAHDAEMVLVGNRAYVVYEANDERAGESAAWPSMYVTMSVVNLDTLQLETVIPIARSAQRFANETLPEGACFVPRILQKDAKTLRCYFASESPGKREAQTYFLDFDLDRQAFLPDVHRARIKTADGTHEMQPKYFHEDAKRGGFTKPAKDFGLYAFDSFKVIQGTTYVALNNYPGGQNALARVNADLDTFEVLGHYNEPAALKLTESAVNQLPDGTWMAIVRQEGGNRNYVFTTSKDGRNWTAGEHLPVVPNGASSKPTFDKIGDVYYLGWQENTQIEGVGRSVFNVEVSRDGRQWERKYRFETPKSFQYPVFREHRGTVYVAVTHGDSDPSRKERIMFGPLRGR
ncbi:MAG: sialidase family protein [Verrucomicrobium sp.]|nr:sialidase family protein [Verrucomicrobium sp.]